MADDDATISYDGAGEGPDSQPDPIDEGSEQRDGPYASEDDEGDELEDDDDGGEDHDPEAPEDGDVDDGRPRQPRRAPVAELEARLQEKESQAHSLTVALRQERERSRVLEDRFYRVIDRAMQHAAGAGEQPTEDGAEGAEPDPEKDAVGAIRSDIAGLRERLERDEQARAEYQVNRQTQGALDWVQRDAAAAVAEEPNYPQAAAFVEAQTRRNIQAHVLMGNPGIDPLDLEDAVEREFVNYIAGAQVRCLQTNQSYAKVILKVARDLGWSSGGRGQGGKREPGRTSRLDAERAARAGGQSLGRVPSALPREQPHAAEIMNMDDDEFDDLLDSGKIDFKQLAASLANGGRR
jgi:hypothetical protein